MNSVSFFSASSHFFSENDQIPRNPQTVLIPIHFPSAGDRAIPIAIHFPHSITAAAALKIQSIYRGRLVRRLVALIRAAASEADRLERLVRRQDTVDAVRRDPRERLRLSEELMEALLRLDAVQGFYPPVRDLRRAVSRRIVGLQEILDAIAAAPELDPLEGIPTSLEEIVGELLGEEDEDDAELRDEEGCRFSNAWKNFY
ncbi:BAG family molecular chaperone regulator 5, mitochondrial [Apostasia shenzhenica]|uniref:BAG family molecular chaperone regulator 5, mitochondrial n=1 Tax=Apostasia shenzhenica TaxID=1088818 RepID=A0A2I0A736_9ASPA|nr:BAG family molecular chaperone regulator 5, mitochondrial [Apostasia shenzhenica]